MEAFGQPVSPAAISQLEKGLSRPTGRTLLTIAETTGFPVEYFVRRRTDADGTPFFRKLRSTPVREQRRAFAWAHLVHDLAVTLDGHIDLPEVDVPRWEIDLTDEWEIEDAANRLRRTWGLGDGPVPNVVRQLERRGIVTARLPLDRHDVDAFSVWFPDRPVVVLGSDKQVTARSRFDASHEVAHLVLHEPDDAGTKEAEAQAHRFAGAFLAPEESIAPALDSFSDWRELLDLKVEWGMSMGALLRRGKDLGVISEARYVSSLKYMSARGWRREEPGDRELGRPEEPRLLRRAVRRLDEAGLPLEEIAYAAGLPVQAIAEVIWPDGARRLDLNL